MDIFYNMIGGADSDNVGSISTNEVGKMAKQSVIDITKINMPSDSPNDNSFLNKYWHIILIIVAIIIIAIVGLVIYKQSTSTSIVNVTNNETVNETNGETNNESINESINETNNETINETNNETINETIDETNNENSIVNGKLFTTKLKKNKKINQTKIISKKLFT